MRRRLYTAPMLRRRLRVRRSNESGFSLLEILVVLVIIGLMSAAVVLSMRPPENAERTFREDFVLRLNQTVKESIYTGRVNALSVSERGLHLMMYADREWQVTREFPFEDIASMQLHIDNERVELPDEVAPLILFEPTGEVTNFQLIVRGFDEDISLFNSPDGSILLGEPT